jgi:cytochrome P450
MSGPRGPHALDLPMYAADDAAVTAAIRQDYLGFLAAVARSCGDIGTYHRDGHPVVLINSPELARELLIDHASRISKGQLQRTAFSALLGESISVSEGERHRALRRLLAPLLTRRRVTGYAAQIVRTAAAACRSWPDAGPIDLFAELHRLTLHTLGRALIAEERLWDEQGEFWHCRQRLWDWITSHSSQGRNLTSAAVPGTGHDFATAASTIRESLDHVIEQRSRTSSVPADLLSSLMAAGGGGGAACPLSRTGIRDQILALLFAAHETSACSLFWSLYLLDQDARARRRIEHEADAAFASRSVSAASVDALPYTQQVLQETMRLYPPAGRQFRVTAKPITLGGYFVPEGRAVTVCQYLLHRRDASFPDAERFDPRRFAPEAQRRHSLAYLPFGAGERICLGRHYAMLETRTLLAYLASQYRFQFPAPVPARLRVTIRPPDRPPAMIRRRGQQC